MTSRRPLLAVLSLLFPVAIVVFAACSDEGEGDRCDTRNTRNGSDDCQQGLSCVPGSDLGSAASGYCEGVTTCGVCCPEDRTQATVSVCALGSTLPGADAAPPVTTTDGGDGGDAGDAASDAQGSGDDGSSDAAGGSDAASTDASDASQTDAADGAG